MSYSFRYRVYGRNFNNKKEAIKYHHEIYGCTNYQASDMFIYKDGEFYKVTCLPSPNKSNKDYI